MSSSPLKRLNAVHFINACLIEIIYHKGLEISDLDLTRLVDFKSSQVKRNSSRDVLNWVGLQEVNKEAALYKTKSPQLRKLQQ